MLKFFRTDPRVQPYSAAAWRLTVQHKTSFIGDTSRMSLLVDKASGEPGWAMAVESITWKTDTEVEAKLAFWNDDTGLAHGPVYTLVKTKRGWVVDILRTGYWGEVA